MTVLVPIVVIALSIYFTMTLFILPEKFLEKEQFVPSPYFEVHLSKSEIKLGDSFRMQIISENRGDYGDIHIVSSAFPNIQSTKGIVKIVSYDLTHTPILIEIGDELGASYSGGLQKIPAQYPSIEAMNRPVPKDSKYNIEYVITPKNTGDFLIYVKAIDIPHTSERSHYPRDGTLDHQNEYVREFVVKVNP